jgi:hypothetical protein
VIAKGKALRLKKSIRERFQELSVSSEPPGADIYLDDRNTGLQGQTNFRFKVVPVTSYFQM